MMKLTQPLIHTVKRFPYFLNINRNLCTNNVQNNISMDENEKKLYNVLNEKFPSSEITILDVSGGCGAMYDVTIYSPLFKGKSIVKQHRMVTDALKLEIKEMHGLRIATHENPFKD